MNGQELVPFERARMRALLRSALPESTSAGASDPVDAARLYVPIRHKRALSRDVTLITGIRGAGKTTWWNALQDDGLRARVAHTGSTNTTRYLSTSRVTAGFGATVSDDYPSRRELTDLITRAEPRDVWRTVVLWSIAKPFVDVLPTIQGWGARVAWIAGNVAASETALKEIDRRLDAEKQTHLILFDALDRCATNWPDIRRLLRGLFETMVDLRELRGVRAKAFVRPDMIAHPSVRTFPDASKLLNDAVGLEWGVHDLYGLFFHLLSNADEPSATWFREECERRFHINWNDPGPSSLEIPDALRSGLVQQYVLNAITGPFMGANHRRGRVFSWLPVHLADAHRQVSPRSFLTALRVALDSSEQASLTAIDHHGLRKGTAKASETRRAEVEEDQPWISKALECLHGMGVPASEQEILRRWEDHHLRRDLERLTTDDARDRPARFDDGTVGILRELEDLGVFGRSADQRVQIPDVYRIAFGMKRRGGVPPVNKG